MIKLAFFYIPLPIADSSSAQKWSPISLWSQSPSQVIYEVSSAKWWIVVTVANKEWLFVDTHLKDW